VPCNATVVRWFRRQRGTALSITSSGASFGMLIFPPLATALIIAFGWREAYLTLGLLAVVGIIACATFMVRDPEKIGLDLDGQHRPVPSSAATYDILLEESWTLTEAKRTSAFWLLNVIFTFTWLVVFIPMVHIVPFAIDLGIFPFLAAMTISVIGFAGFAGRLVVGPISDRYGRLSTVGVSLLLQALSFGAFAISRGPAFLYCAASLFGFSYGVTAIFPALIGDFFGRSEVGAIVGFITALAGAPAAFGPLLAGYIYDVSHSYTAAFELSAALNIAALLLLFLLKQPQRATSI